MLCVRMAITLTAQKMITLQLRSHVKRRIRCLLRNGALSCTTEAAAGPIAKTQPLQSQCLPMPQCRSIKPPPSQWLQGRWCPAAESARVNEQQALVAQDGTVVHHRGGGVLRVPGPVSLHILLAPLTLPLCVHHLTASQP